MTHVVNWIITHRTRKYIFMLFLEVRSTHYCLFNVIVSYNLVNLLLVIAEHTQCTRNGLVNNTHGTATDQLLHFHEAKVWLDTSRVTVHHKTDGTSWRQYGSLCVTHAILLAQLNCFIPGSSSCAQEFLGDKTCI